MQAGDDLDVSRTWDSDITGDLSNITGDDLGAAGTAAGPEESGNDLTESYFSNYQYGFSCSSRADPVSEARDKSTHMFHLDRSKEDFNDLADPLAYLYSHGFANADPDMHRRCPEEYESVPGPWTRGHYFYMCVNTGECFRVDSDTANLTEDEVRDNWAAVDAADRAELDSFNAEGVFALVHQHSTTQRANAIWVRKSQWVEG